MMTQRVVYFLIFEVSKVFFFFFTIYMSVKRFYHKALFLYIKYGVIYRSVYIGWQNLTRPANLTRLIRL